MLQRGCSRHRAAGDSLGVLPQQDLSTSWQNRGFPSPKIALSPTSWPRDPSGGIRAAAGGLLWQCDGQEVWGSARCWAVWNLCLLEKAAGSQLDALLLRS